MRQVWSEASKLRRWREVELAVLAARAELGQVPAEAAVEARGVPTPSRQRVLDLEQHLRHDVLAFVTAWTESMTRQTATAVHRDLTSSDVVDTALALALREAGHLVDAAAQSLIDCVVDKAIAHRDTQYLARTHGQAAVPDVFGHRLADFAFALERSLRRLRAAQADVAVAKVSGPAGTYVGLGPEAERRVADLLGLTAPSVSTQVVFRDGVAAWVGALALLAATCESIALDVRLGQQEGVGELFEPSGPAQLGSSAMPHKQNPIDCEKVCGLARVVRGYLPPILEDIALWQHRDISHSSVERIVLPDAAALTEYMLITMAKVVENLVVNVDAMRRNLEVAGPKIASSRLLSDQLAAGVERATATRLVSETVSGGASEGSAIEQTGKQADPRLDVRGAVDRAVAEVRASEGLGEVFDRLLSLRSST